MDRVKNVIKLTLFSGNTLLLMTVFLIIMKLCNILTCGWLWVFSPMLFYIGFASVVSILIFIFSILIFIFYALISVGSK